MLCVYFDGFKASQDQAPAVDLFFFNSSIQKDVRLLLIRPNVFGFQPVLSAAFFHRCYNFIVDVYICQCARQGKNTEFRPTSFLLALNIAFARARPWIQRRLCNATGDNGLSWGQFRLYFNWDFCSGCIATNNWRLFHVCFEVAGVGAGGRGHKPEQVVGSGSILWIECIWQERHF